MNYDQQRTYKKVYWIEGNKAFARPHFRMEKCARLVNRLSRGRECDLLDLGCGPGVLASLLDAHIHYFGIDIAIQVPGSNFIELDLLENPIRFNDMRFDFVVASGFFEYMDNAQLRKFKEIDQILKPGGSFIVTYSNIHHRRWNPDQPWNNVQTINQFRNDLQSVFHIDHFFASSHTRRFFPPENSRMKTIQMRLNIYIPLISPRFASEFFFICSRREIGRAA